MKFYHINILFIAELEANIYRIDRSDFDTNRIFVYVDHEDIQKILRRTLPAALATGDFTLRNDVDFNL